MQTPDLPDLRDEDRYRPSYPPSPSNKTPTQYPWSPSAMRNDMPAGEGGIDTDSISSVATSVKNYEEKIREAATPRASKESVNPMPSLESASGSSDVRSTRLRQQKQIDYSKTTKQQKVYKN